MHLPADPLIDKTFAIAASLRPKARRVHVIDLYGGSSPNAMKVVLMLEELQLPYTFIEVNAFRGEQYSPEFLKLNPLGKYPVIIDHSGAGPDQPIFESGAILQYLAETYDKSGLLPASGPARWEVLQWLTVQVAWVGPMLGQHVHFRIHPSESGGYAAGRYKNLAIRVFDVLDARLATQPYLAGANYSIADIATYPWVRVLKSLGFAWADYPHLKKWFDAIGGRPAAVETELRYKRLASAMAFPASEEDLNRFFGRSGGPEVHFEMLRPNSPPVTSERS
jgi:GST-like protein